MRKHPDYAYHLLSPIPYLRPAIDIPYCHHEKWDGTGYPRGLRGEQIPRSARMFAVSTSGMPCFRIALIARVGQERVVDHLRSLAGTHLEPEAVEAFIQMLASDEGRIENLPREQRIGEWGNGPRTAPEVHEKSTDLVGSTEVVQEPGLPASPAAECSGSPSFAAPADLSWEARHPVSVSSSPTVLLAGIRDQETEHLVRNILHESAYAVMTAPDGEQAWHIVQQGHVRVVVAQWHMAGLDGPELCHRVRSHSGGVYTYIILIAEHSEHRDRLDALTSGADDFLVTECQCVLWAAPAGAARRRREQWQERWQEHWQGGDGTRRIAGRIRCNIAPINLRPAREPNAEI